MAILAMLGIATGPETGISVPPCAEEDSTNCYWDASTRGNGVGTSFVALGGRTGEPHIVIWLEHLNDNQVKVVV